MLSTVAGLHPKSCAIENFDRPTALIRIMVALRKIVLSVVAKRMLSKASHCSSVNVHAAMTTSVKLEKTSCTEFIDKWPAAEVLLRVYLAKRHRLHRLLVDLQPKHVGPGVMADHIEIEFGTDQTFFIAENSPVATSNQRACGL